MEFVLQMIQDLVNDGSVFDHGDDLHLYMTVGTKQGIRFVDELNQGSPGFFSLLDPITFGIFFTCMLLGSLIRAVAHALLLFPLKHLNSGHSNESFVLPDQEYAR